MTRDVGFGDKPKDDPAARRTRGIITFAIAEMPGVLALVAAMVVLYTDLPASFGWTMPEISEQTRVTYTIAAVVAYMIYAGALVLLILLPALRKADDAR